MSNSANLEQLCIDTIRLLAVDAVEKATCGHPGMPMGCAPLSYLLWTKHLKHNPTNPDWANRDRFVLSAGHGCMLLYSMLHLTGYDLSLDDIKEFRQMGSKTPGHSEVFHTPGVETTTGPLGQGFGNAVGMALAGKYLGAYFNRPGHEIFDYTIYGICGDGDLMEGVASEAASLAGHLKLDNLIFFYDDNHISIEGHTSLAFTEDRAKRFEAYGWHVAKVADGNDLAAIEQAIQEAKQVKDKPKIIMVRTVIGYGSPNKADTHGVHGAALGKDEVIATKKNLGWDPEKHFHIPDEVKVYYGKCVEAGKALEAAWNEKFEAYRAAHPDLAGQLEDWRAGKLPAGWDLGLPTFQTGASVATRSAQQKVLDVINPRLPMLIGGSADLHPSNNTYVPATGDFQHPSNQGDTGTYAGRNLHFGVREHGMASICNGIALNTGLIPYCATFMCFVDYLKPALRLSAVMGVRVIYVFTHDSIGLGEDGPTHQPIEHLSMLRGIINVHTIRPSDATEVPLAWKAALARTEGPTAIILTRQGIPVIDRSKFGAAEGLFKGGYILADCAGKPELILLSSGSEVQFALGAKEILEKEGKKVRVVAMPCMELFEQQDQAYRESVLPPDVRKRVAVEAAEPQAWYKYVGLDGACVGMRTYGLSGPYKKLYEHFGFTSENVANVAKGIL